MQTRLQKYNTEAERLFTIDEMAQLTSLKVSHLRSLIFKKKVPYIKIGRLIRFKLSEFEIFINANTVAIENFN